MVQSTTVKIVFQEGRFWLRVEDHLGIVMSTMSPASTVRDAMAERDRIAAASRSPR